jgi:hypothetical protein
MIQPATWHPARSCRLRRPPLAPWPSVSHSPPPTSRAKALPPVSLAGHSDLCHRLPSTGRRRRRARGQARAAGTARTGRTFQIHLQVLIHCPNSTTHATIPYYLVSGLALDLTCLSSNLNFWSITLSLSWFSLSLILFSPSDFTYLGYGSWKQISMNLSYCEWAGELVTAWTFWLRSKNICCSG